MDDFLSAVWAMRWHLMLAYAFIFIAATVERKQR